MSYLICILLIILIALILTVIGFVLSIRNKARSFLNRNFGTPELAEALQNTKLEASKTPKSISDVTSIKLPVIAKDFPEFNIGDMKARAENVAVSYLRAIDELNPAILSEGGPELKTALTGRIEELKSEGKREHFEQVAAHKTGLTDYRKGEGRCIAVFKTSVQAVHFLKDEEGKLISGDEKYTEQFVVETELVYIQDAVEAAKETDGSLSLNCPNCGAPITNLGNKFCEYCGTAVKEINIKVWNFEAVKILN